MITNIIPALQICIAIGFIGFWIHFFMFENKNLENSEVYLGFERAFPIPDLCWVTPSLFFAAIGLLMEESYGFFSRLLQEALYSFWDCWTSLSICRLVVILLKNQTP